MQCFKISFNNKDRPSECSKTIKMRIKQACWRHVGGGAVQVAHRMLTFAKNIYVFYLELDGSIENILSWRKDLIDA